jgi:hypothetical protein
MSSLFSRALGARVALAALAALVLLVAPGAGRAQGCTCRMRAAGPEAQGDAAPGDPPPPFLAASVCALCHSNAPAASAMRDPRRREVSPVLLWSGTAMASSFRDVIWKAAVAAEVAAAPEHEREIVGTCLRCHAPMGARTAEGRDAGLDLLRAGRAGELTGDGVSCTVCHRISAEGLGEPSTFGGAFHLVADGQIVGPHADPFTMPMLHHTGFEPVQGDQVLRPALCATCHTVITPALADAPAGASFLEQGPYLEWRNSVFAAEGTGTGASCQACHAPVRSAEDAVIETRIARNPHGGDFPPIDHRTPYGRHAFVGGNTLLPRILAGGPAEPGTDRPAYGAVAALAEEQLARRTARLEIVRATVSGRALSFAARIENLTGHKFPTGHPSRRAWLRVRVLDGAGRVLFASGEHDRAGRILGASGAPLAAELPGGPARPHRATIRGRDEVQVYELVMEDGRGQATDTLLRAVRARKDDRILPAGWSPDHADAARTSPVGTSDDGDFVAGADLVAYELELPPRAKRPLRVEVTLLYQGVSARHAAALVAPGGEPARVLAAALERHGNAPAVVAVARRALR